MAGGVQTIVGVAGGSCSGKSHFCRALVERLGEERVLHLSHDAYYRDRRELPLAERAALNYDCPEALETELLLEHLARLCRGEEIEVPGYDFATHARLPPCRRLAPRPILLLEGILVLAEARLRERLDLALYLEVSDEVRLARRVRRDTAERGRTREAVLAQFASTVRPMHEALVEPSRAYADLVIPYEHDNPRAVEAVAAWLREAVGGREHWPRR